MEGVGGIRGMVRRGGSIDQLMEEVGGGCRRCRRCGRCGEQSKPSFLIELILQSIIES